MYFTFKTKFFLASVIMVCAMAFMGASHAFAAATITVDTNGSTAGVDGNCVLVEAIVNANTDGDSSFGDCVAGSGTDTIVFSGPMTITPADTLVITSPIIFDGITGGNGTCTTKSLGVILDGTNATGHLLTFAAGSDGSRVKGLVLKNYDHMAIGIQDAIDIAVTCNMIGVDETGNTSAGGSQVGISAIDSSNIVIGTPTSGDGNVFGSNDGGYALSVDGISTLTIQGNLFGLQKSGTAALGIGTMAGISIGNSSNILLGGSTAGARNVISGNGAITGDPVIIISSDSSDIVIQGNYIGTDITGMNAIPNSGGINICGVNCGGSIGHSNVTIGGSNAGEGNVISGNDGAGFNVDWVTSGTVTIQGNYIGVASDGVTPLGNQGSGIAIVNNNGPITVPIQIGGATAGARNIVANNSAQGIIFYGGVSDVTIQGNYIGIAADGTTVGPNGNSGIQVADGGGDTIMIGGSNAGEGNVISGNAARGIQIQAGGTSNVSILGNLVGVLPDGVTAAGNTEGIGVSEVTGLIIGGVGANERNIVAGSTDGGGIIIQDSSDVTVYNNYIGIGSNGTTVVANDTEGLYVGNSTNVTIGGTASSQKNSIVGSTNSNLVLLEEVTDFTMKANYVGVKPDGVTVVPGAAGAGIDLFNSSDGVIGGTTDAEGNLVYGQLVGIKGVVSAVTVQKNTISQNTLVGVLTFFTSLAPTDVSIAFLQNSIFDNGFGIDISQDLDGELTPETGFLVQNLNDVGDADTGANNDINHPVITKTVQSGSDTIVTYFLDVPVSANPYHVEFFTNPSGLDTSRFGEGEIYEDFANVTVSSAGQQTFTKTLIGVVPDDVITATVTDCTNIGCTTFGGTSEFSNASPKGVDFGTATGDDTDLDPQGAYHVIGTNYLGSCVNADLGTLATNDASVIQTGAYTGTGPCATDIDGVDFDAESYVINTTITATVDASADGYVNVWFDEGADGTFDTGDYVIENEAVTTGVNTITFSAPPHASIHNARFRFTSYELDGMAPIGEALDGEVEDYAITITAPASSGGGGSSGGTQFGCKDPAANNYYPGPAVSKPSLCVYGSQLSVTPPPPLTPSVNIVKPSVCPVFTKYYRQGDRGGEIPKIQAFLNQELGLALKADGSYGQKTADAVGQFQQKYFSYIIAPWNPPFGSKVTKRWYKTTSGTANVLAGCVSAPVILEDNGVNWKFEGIIKK